MEDTIKNQKKNGNHSENQKHFYHFFFHTSSLIPTKHLINILRRLSQSALFFFRIQQISWRSAVRFPDEKEKKSGLTGFSENNGLFRFANYAGFWFLFENPGLIFPKLEL